LDDRDQKIAAARARVDAAVAAVAAIETRLDAMQQEWAKFGKSRYSETVDDQEASMAASEEMRAAESELSRLLDAR